jgi:hypothetical protein
MTGSAGGEKAEGRDRSAVKSCHNVQYGRGHRVGAVPPARPGAGLTPPGPRRI